MHNLTYLFAAYSLIFAVLFLYLMFLSRCDARLERDISHLEARLSAAKGQQTSKAPDPSETS